MLAVLLPMVMALPAGAAELPRYDQQAYCRKMSGLSGSSSGPLYDNCLRSEERARIQLAPRWARLDGAKQSYCDALSRSAGFGRYARLKSCTDQQLALAERPARRR